MLSPTIVLGATKNINWKLCTKHKNLFKLCFKLSFENKVSKKQILKTNSNQDWNSNLNIKKSHEIKTQNEKNIPNRALYLKRQEKWIIIF